MTHNPNDVGLEKARLRRGLLARRARLPPEEVARASRAVQARLRGLEAWRAARSVLVYLAYKGEISTLELLEELWGRGVTVLAPRCRPDQAGLLDLACLMSLEQLTPGAWGILEPHPEACPALTGCAPDLALIPAVAFDRSGGRLGFGQGYYDRLLAGPGFADTTLIGLAHGFQVVETLPRDPWDRPVHVVLTPEETLLCG